MKINTHTRARARARAHTHTHTHTHTQRLIVCYKMILLYKQLEDI